MPALALPTVDLEISWRRRQSGLTAILRQVEGGGWQEIARTAETQYVVQGAHPERAHVFAVAAVLEDGGLDAEDEWEVIRVAPAAARGRPDLPSAPAGFAIAQTDGVLEARWDPATDGVPVTYEIRVGSSWEDGRLVAEGVRGTSWSWPWEATGSRTYFLKAVDQLCRASRGSAQVTLTVDPLDDHVTDGTHDEGGGGWGGTKDDVEVDTGTLRLTALPPFGALTMPFGSLVGLPCLGRYYASGTYETDIQNVGALERHRIEVDLTGVTQPTDTGLPFGAIRRPALGRSRRRDGTRVPLGTRGFAAKNSWRMTPLDPVDILVEIDTSPTSGGSWDGWRRWVPGVYTFWRARLRLTLAGDGLRFPKLGGFVWRRRLKNKKLEDTVSVGTSTPVNVTFDPAFQRAPVITAGVLGSTEVVDFDSVTASGFTIQPLATAGTVHWHALGT